MLRNVFQALEEANEEAAKSNAEKKVERKKVEQEETTSKQIDDLVPAKKDAAQSQESDREAIVKPMM
ncbi:hypothetical protein REPUB_Repub03eG0282200 [Reevesia pubescens]